MYKKSFLSVAAIAALAIGMVSVTTTADAQKRVTRSVSRSIR